MGLDPELGAGDLPAGVEEDRSKSGIRKWVPGVTAGVSGFLAWQYGKAVWRLAHQSGGMDNKFSKLAREEHLAFLAGQNLQVLVAYLILAVIGVLLILPVVGWWSKRSRWQGLPAVTLRSFAIAALLHGFFMFRLVFSRPYFLGDAEFGAWYYRILDLPPASLRPALNTVVFSFLPWVGLAAVVLWWILALRPKARIASLSLASVIGGGVFVLPRAIPAGESDQAGLEKGSPPNVIIIASDSLRGDRLGYSGYRPSRHDGAAAEGVSPNIDRWAAGAVRFSQCRTPIASTLESAVTVMSSQYPHTHGIRQMYPSRERVEESEAAIRTVAQVLRERGYDTSAIGDWCAGFYEMMPLGFEDVSVSSFDNFRIYMSQAVMMAHFVVPLYFDNDLGYRLFPQIGSFAQFVTPDVVTRRVEEKLARQAEKGRPFFWHVFYSCNHLPYRSAEPYCGMFSEPGYRGAHQNGVDFDIDAFIGGTDLEDKWKALPEEEIRQIRALYDGCTRQFDACFARILDALRRHGLLENTIVVVTADHGDDLYEPGVTLGHGLGFNGADHSFHIPLAIRAPGVAPSEIASQVRSIDIAPTLLELVGADVPSGWEGRSLAPWMRGGPAGDLPYYGETGFPFIQFKVPGVERPALPPMDELTFIDPDFNHQFVLKPEWLGSLIGAKQRCLRTRDWKIVCTPGRDGGRHFGLFHTASDPDCRRDLATERPEVLAPMRAALERWIDHRHETPVPEIFPDGEP